MTPKAPVDNVPAKNARGKRRKHTARLTTAKRVRPITGDPDALPRGEAVRASVRHAALECFGAFGFEGTSTRAVAERAGISHSLLLYHFKSKDELWRSTLAEVLEHYIEELNQHWAAVPIDDPAAQLRAFIEHFVRYSARIPQLQRIMTQQSTQASDRIEWLIERYLQESFAQLCDLIRRAQAAGQVIAGEPERVYYAIIGLAGVPLAVSTEFRLLAGRDLFTEPEIKRSIVFIESLIFLD